MKNTTVAFIIYSGNRGESVVDAAEALGELEDAYRGPGAAVARVYGAGEKAVAYCGQGIPEELILAAGCQPVALIPQAGHPTPIADDQFDTDGDPWLKSMFEQIVGSAGDQLELVVLAPPFAEVSSIIEDLRRHEVAFELVTPTFYFELALRQTPRNRRYAEDRTRALARRLSALIEAELAASRITAAIALTNRRRESMRRLIELRRSGSAVSGATAYRLLGARKFMDPERYTECLDTVISSLGHQDDLSRRPRLVLAPSAALNHDQAHVALEAAGALIVAEDDSGGARSDTQLIETAGDPITAIADHYHQTTLGHHMMPAERRLEWIKNEAIKPDVDGVVFYAEDSFFGWDYPELKKYLEAHGKPSILFDADARSTRGRDELETMARPFVERLAKIREERSL